MKELGVTGVLANMAKFTSCPSGSPRKLRGSGWDFPGGPVLKTLCFYCKGLRFNPWPGNSDPTCCVCIQVC